MDDIQQVLNSDKDNERSKFIELLKKLRYVRVCTQKEEITK